MAAYAPRLFWDGRLEASDLPTLVRDHMTEAHFMNMDGRLAAERRLQMLALVEEIRPVERIARVQTDCNLEVASPDLEMSVADLREPRA